jgi:hypothetical protein
MSLQRANFVAPEELVESKLRLEQLELLLCELLHENECLRMALDTGDKGSTCGNTSRRGPITFTEDPVK